MKHFKYLFIFLIALVLVGCELTPVLPNANEDKYGFSVSDKSIQLELDQSFDLSYEVKIGHKVSYEMQDPSIAVYDGMKVTALSSGETFLDFIIDRKVVASVKIKVLDEIVYNFTTSIDDLMEMDQFTIEEGEKVQFTAQSDPQTDGLMRITVEGSAVKFENGELFALEEGSAQITISIEDQQRVINVLVTEGLGPVISLKEGVLTSDLTASWNEEIDVLAGLDAIDSIDGDVAASLRVVTNYDKQTYGEQTVVIEASDHAGHKTTFERKVNVVWDYSVMFIGHAGSYYGLMNSEEAFLYAAQVLKYQAMECDLKQTSDGVFVMSHNDTFGDYTIASTPYSTFENYEITQGRSAGYPAQNGTVVNSPYTTKLCTLERYLEICKEYNMWAVIELKSSAGITNSDQSRMQALMDKIEECGMLNQVIFLASQYNCLIWTRTHGYEYIPCQYLVNSCENETYLNRCLENDLDISINVTDNYSNSDEWLAKYYEKGIKVSTYTFTQYVNYDVVQTWIDKGVHFVTCDWQLMSNLNLPKEDNEVKKYTVRFYDGDELLKETIVKQGRTAATPTNPTKLGHKFMGWDKAISDVQQDLDVYAVWELDEYTITYVANNYVVNETTWATKADFVAEFYGDLFSWIEENYTKFSEITKSDGVYTMTKNGKTAVFSSAEELLQLDLYVFEKTISNLIYKPVVRNADDSCDIVPDENYFLNSSKYLEKYRAIDAWLMKAINTGYTSYRKTYEPLSDGRIQIFFRMHQHMKGNGIAAFNPMPVKYEVTSLGEVTLPVDHLNYNFESSFTLSVATLEGKTFGGWYLDRELTQKLEAIVPGMSGNITLYAKWE